MYQHKVDVDMLDTVKSVLANTLAVQRSAQPDQPYVDTLYVLPPRRHRPKLVLTGTSIPLYMYFSSGYCKPSTSVPCGSSRCLLIAHLMTSLFDAQTYKLKCLLHRYIDHNDSPSLTCILHTRVLVWHIFTITTLSYSAISLGNSRNLYFIISLIMLCFI